MDINSKALGINLKNLKPFNVMIVDDSKMDRLLLEKYLKSEMFNIVYMAENGKQALDLLKLNSEGVDIVCMDYDMPVMNGVETLKVIVNEYPKIKTIMITRSTEKEVVLELTKLKVTTIIIKPISREQVYEKFTKALQRTDLLKSEEIISVNSNSEPQKQEEAKAKVVQEKKVPLGIDPKTKQPYRVMIVDDSKIDQNLLKKYLQTEMFSIVSLFNNGQEAIDDLEVNSQNYDLICIDYEMPVLNGVDTLKYIKSNHPGLKVVMITAHSSTDVVRMLFSLKVDSIIVKPIRREQILEKLANLFQRKDLLAGTVIGFQTTGGIDLNNLKIPPAPHILMKILQSEFSTTEGSAELENIIAPDRAITVDILRISNSAFYGRSGKVKSLKDAITLLGVKTVKNLVMVLTNKNYTNQLKGELFKKYITDLPILSSLISLDLLAPLKQKNLSNEIFTFSLLRRIGSTIMAVNYSKRYYEILKLLNVGTKNVISLEQDEFLVNSIDVGRKVFKMWAMPEEFILLIQNQNFSINEVKSVTDIDRITRLSEIIAKKLMRISLMPEEEAMIAEVLNCYEADKNLMLAFNEDYFDNIKDHPYFASV